MCCRLKGFGVFALDRSMDSTCSRGGCSSDGRLVSWPTVSPFPLTAVLGAWYSPPSAMLSEAN